MSKLKDSMTKLRDMLAASTLPDELVDRINKFMEVNHDPKNLSDVEQKEIAYIIEELKQRDMLYLIGL